MKINNSGFTLVELIAVMVLLGILGVTAVTRFNLSTSNLDSAAKQLRSNIQYAQDLAMTRGSVYGFRSTSTTAYEIYDGAPGVPAINPLTRTNFTVSISPVVFSGVVPSVEFGTDGKPTLAADAVITLSDAGATRTITVKRNTGFVTLTSP